MSRFTGNTIADNKSDAILNALVDIKNTQRNMDIYQKKVMEWDVPDMKQLGICDHYLIFDSYQKLEDSHPERGEYKFNFSPRGGTSDQAIGIRDDITRMIEMTVSKFTIPLTKLESFNSSTIVAANPTLSILGLAANTSVPVADISNVSSRHQQYAHQRITMYMRDIGMQSFIDNEGSRHHFEFDISAIGHIKGSGSGDKLLLTPIDDNYVFTDPINHVHGMSINFFNPDYPLKMPPDVIYGVTLYSATPNTAASPTDNIIQFRFSEPTAQLELLYGDRIYFKGFESYYTLSSTNAKITQNYVLNRYINRQEGHIICEDIVSVTSSIVSLVVNASSNVYNIYLNPNIKTINLDNLTSSGSVGTAYANGEELKSKTRVNMYIAKNRIRIPIRFRTLTKKYTNGIVAT